MLFLTIFIYYSITTEISHVEAKMYGCSDGLVNLNMNEIAFYETTNFPQDLNGPQMKACNLTFGVENGRNVTKNMPKMFTAFVQFSLNGETGAVYSFLTTDKLSVKIQDTFHWSHYPLPNRTSQKGIVIFEENVAVADGNDDACPLESLSKTKPFVLNNNEEIIYLYSNFYMNKTRKQSCYWRFGAPSSEYGFKIVIQNYFASSEAILRIKNSTALLLNERSIKLNHPYYNSDIYLEIFLSKPNPNYIAEIEFQAYISIIKREQEIQMINCPITHIGNDMISWTNIIEDENYYGYQDSIQCNFDFVIPDHFNVMVNVYFRQIEDDVDILEYTTDNKTTIVSAVFFSDTQRLFVLESYENGTSKHYSWKFVSDGNVHFVGFEILFKFIHCQCENQIFECGNNNFTLMNRTGSYDDYYCGNLECNITIEACPSELTYFEINFEHNMKEPYDIFRIFSNNQIVLDINSQTQTRFTIYLNSANINILQVITFSSLKVRGLKLRSNSLVTEPVFSAPIILSENNTNAILYPPINSYIPIEMDKSVITHNISFIFYCLIPSSITLYNNKNLTQPLKNCFNENSLFYKCNIKETKFVLFQSDNPVVSAIRLSSGSKNCIFKENIYFGNAYNHDQIIVSAVANENGACPLTVILEAFYMYRMSHFWTTSKTENVKVFAGNDQKNLIFEFNSATLGLWKDIILTEPVYNIMLPKSAALYILLEIFNKESLDITEYPYKSIIATPFYGINFDSFDTFLTYRIKEYPTKFTVLDYTYSENNVVFFTIGFNQININKTGDVIIVQNQDIDIGYQSFGCNNVKCGALFLVETYNISLRENF